MNVDGLTAGAVARRLGVAVTTLRTWHQRYDLGPSAHEPGKHRRYTEEDVARTMDLVRTSSYGRAFEPFRGVEARFVDAGHILGSAAVHLTVRARDGRTTSVGFTGDLGRTNVPILRDPEPLGEVDWYLTESTYGDREHEDESGIARELAAVVARTAARGGRTRARRGVRRGARGCGARPARSARRRCCRS